MRKYTNPEAHGYLIEAKACKKIAVGFRICIFTHLPNPREWLKRNGCNCKEYGVNKKKTQ